ncbi:MAG: sulfatase-like hydrolase/transferase, partial [Defluviitaleaceae bacterium]|nr:sulfatase-like hydrolase/transferase [Defluviitaleaceae bacterium]
PHSPCMCPPPYSSMYEGYEFPKSPNVYDTLEDKPDYQKLWAGKSLNEDKGSLRIRGKHFFGCNSFIDSQIGRVIDAAESLAPGAVVIYTSDHGDFLSSHSLLAKGCAVYDEAARVPFIISGGTAKPGSVGKNPVSHINIAPTVMELMGCDIPEMMEGPSLVSELADPSQRTNEFVFIEFGRFSLEHDGWGGFQPMRAVFDGRHKLAVHLLSTDELYDIESDPYEMRNLIYDADRTAVRDRLHDTLLAHMNLTRDPFRGYYWERRPWRTDAARATWPYTGMMRDRHEDERYERRPLDYGTGIPLAHHTHEGNNGFWI